MGTQRYLLRGEGGVFSEVSLDWNDELLHDLEAIAGPIADPGAASRLGERLRDLVDPGVLAALDGLANERRPARVELRAAAAELYALPWELLALRPSGLWFAQLPERLLTYAWPGAAAPPAATSEHNRLLLGWSDAGGSVPWRAQRDAIQAAFEGVVPWSPEEDSAPRLSLADLRARLQAARAAGRPYTALHLLAHGRSGPTGGALLLGGATGPEAIEATELRAALADHADTLRLVVLCACQSAAYGALDGAVGGLALAVHRLGVEAVIGARQPITLHAAQVLTESLYPALVRDSVSLEEAFCRAREALRGAGSGLAWTSAQLWLHRDPHGDCRPFVLRPYRGLLPFDLAQAPFFFGRHAEGRALSRRVLDAFAGRAPRAQLLCGASGAGKSSLLGASLIAEMASVGVRVERRRVEQLLTTPLEPRDGRRTLIVVDPLDDLFTTIHDPDERDKLAEGLRARSMEPGVVVLAAIRLELLSRLDELSWGDGKMDRLITDETSRMFLTAPDGESLLEAVTAPAARVGLSLDPGLADRLILDAGHEAGALPALQHVLDQLWLAREGRHLTHAAYQAMGGLSGALAQSADDALAKLDEAGRRRARRALLAMVSGDGEGVAISRRWVSLRALCGEDLEEGAATARLIHELTSARLLIQAQRDGEALVTLAHDALLRRWEPLRRWAVEDGDQTRRVEALLRLAQEWTDHHTDPDGGASYLLRGARLGYAQELTRGLTPPTIVAALLSASEASEAAERQARAEASAARERLIEALEASSARVRDLALLTSAQATIVRDQTLAVQLLREVSELPQPLDWIMESWAALERPTRVEEWPVEGGVCVPRQTSAKIVYADGARLISKAPGRPGEALAVLDAPARSIDADGQTLWILTATGALFAGQPEALRKIPHEGRSLSAVSVAPGGQRVALGSADGGVWVIRPDGTTLARLRGHIDEVFDLGWSPDGRLLLTSSRDGTARLWGLDGGQRLVIREDGASVTGASLSPDGQALVVLTSAGVARGLNAEGGTERWRVSLGAPLLCAAWGPRLLLGDRSGHLFVLDDAGRVVTRLQGRPEAVNTLRWLGATEAVSAGPTTLSRWRLSSESQAPRRHSLAAPASGVMDFNPKDDTFAVASIEHTISLQPLDDRPRRVLVGHTQRVRAMAWRADGQALLSGGNDRTARRWRLDAGAVALPHEDVVRAVGWLGDGAAFVTGDASGVLLVWRDGETPEVVDRHELMDEIHQLRRSPEGVWLVAHGALGSLTFLGADGSTWRPPSELMGVVLATAWRGETLHCVLRGGDLALLTPSARAIERVEGHPGPWRTVAVSGDDLAASGEDGVVQVKRGDRWVKLFEERAAVTRRMEWLGVTGPLVGLTERGELWAWGREDLDEPQWIHCDMPLVEIRAAESGDWLVGVTQGGGLRLWPMGARVLRALLTDACQIPLRPDQRRRYATR